MVSQANKDLKKILVSFRIPEALFSRVKEYMKTEEINFSEAMVQLIKKGLGKGAKK